MNEIRVLVADDLGLARAGLIDLLAKWEYAHVVSEATNTQQALATARAVRPDLVLIDLHLPGNSGTLDLLDILHREQPQTQIIVLAEPGNDATLAAALKAGACGHLLTDQEPTDLLVLLRKCFGPH